jgi:glycerate 2-kinase
MKFTKSQSALQSAAHAEPQRQMLRDLFDAALRAVDPLQVLPHYLPLRPRGRTVVVGAGKASARMALALERAWDGPLTGLVVTRYGHSEPCQRIEVVEAGHPVPDACGQAAATRILQFVDGLTADDLVIALISGGGSSLLSAPAQGITLQDKRDVTDALLKSGATIAQINCVRRHLSAIKGGKLSQRCGAATVATLVVSDVPGDDPRVVASGPTLADDSTPQDALQVLARYGIQPPLRVFAALRLGLVKPPDVPLGVRHCSVIATAQLALDSAAVQARAMGLTPVILGNALEGEARHVGTVLAGMARQVATADQPAQKPVVLLSGGETTVTVQGSGRGGRNVELLLSQAMGTADLSNVWGLAADTDGIDGSQTSAGALFGPDTLLRAQALGLNAVDFLARNDAYGYFEALDDLVVTGPTRTNVNDFRATLIL